MSTPRGPVRPTDRDRARWGRPVSPTGRQVFSWTVAALKNLADTRKCRPGREGDYRLCTVEIEKFQPNNCVSNSWQPLTRSAPAERDDFVERECPCAVPQTFRRCESACTLERGTVCELLAKYTEEVSVKATFMRRFPQRPATCQRVTLIECAPTPCTSSSPRLQPISVRRRVRCHLPWRTCAKQRVQLTRKKQVG